LTRGFGGLFSVIFNLHSKILEFSIEVVRGQGKRGEGGEVISGGNGGREVGGVMVVVICLIFNRD
jgi:hypothetical protein